MTLNARSRKTWLLLAAFSLTCILLFGCAQETTAPTEEAAPAPMVEKSLLNPSSLTEQAPDKYTARLETSKGPIRIDVTRSSAPLGADRFYILVKNGFYNDSRFFLVMPGYAVQFGLSGDPAINTVWKEQLMQDDPVTRTNRRGTVSFAALDRPNSRSTQVFINLAGNSFLDNQGYAPIGMVAEGMDVVDSLYSGYGRTPDLASILNEGNEYLSKKFPKLDYIKTATIE